MPKFTVEIFYKPEDALGSYTKGEVIGQLSFETPEFKENERTFLSARIIAYTGREMANLVGPHEPFMDSLAKSILFGPHAARAIEARVEKKDDRGIVDQSDVDYTKQDEAQQEEAKSFA